MIASVPILALMLLAAVGVVAMLIVLFKALRSRAVVVLFALALMGLAGLLLLAPMNSRRHVAVWPRIMETYSGSAHMHARPGEPMHPPQVVLDLDALDEMQDQLSELAGRGVETAQRIAHDAYDMAVQQTELAWSDETVAPAATAERAGSPASAQMRVSARDGVSAMVRTAPPRRDADRTWRKSILHNILTALEIAAFLCVAYVFLDGATRGQFTWALRLLSVVAFAAIYVALTSLRHQL